ncbi:hypothetical protein M758_8G178400 [Ceratodon purpureus]|uniref:DUF7748 domain-containing protein n=1 Tax=Ceratodon purpureus TaxID=3225 RepID=A0A8T0H3H9_CERPU|nr:hypothetical protein KC19_8G183300 [Ceratodon purpureus]KAG0609354.1 hypothetical protein M758_8G178400 [Ceratodon purpureus]
MAKTTVKNTTKSVVVLNESQAGILRKLCDLQPNGSYVVSSQLNQTYKEYLCVSNNCNQFTLSSDDLCEWKEIVIEQTQGDPGKLAWKGTQSRTTTSKAKGPNPAAASGTQPTQQPTQPSSSLLSKLSNRVAGWFHETSRSPQ